MSQSPETWTCDQVREHLEALLEDELASHDARDIGVHLESCPECATQVRLAREIQHELRSLPELDAPAPLLYSIFDQTVRKEARRSSPVRTWGRWPQPVWAGLAAAAFALAVGLGAFWQGNTEEERPDAAAVAQATAEARYALAKTGLLTRKAGQVIRDEALRDQIVVPTTDGISQVLGTTEDRLSSGVSTKGVSDA